MWLIDSSAFIDWMRKGISPTRALKPHVLAGQAAICGVVRVEVLRGMVRTEAKNEIAALFDVMREVPVTASVWNAVSELAWSLDRKGNVLPLSDLVIAACALQVKATVVTLDPHFKHIPGLGVLAHLPGAEAQKG